MSTNSRITCIGIERQGCYVRFIGRSGATIVTFIRHGSPSAIRIGRALGVIKP